VLRGVAKHPTAGSWCGREAAVWTCGGGVEARWKGGGVPVGDGARSDGGLCQPQRQNLADQTLVLVALSHNQVPHHVPQRMIRIELQTIWKDNSEEFSRIRGASSCESVESASHASATFPLGGCLIDQTTLPTQRGARSASSGSHSGPLQKTWRRNVGGEKYLPHAEHGLVGLEHAHSDILLQVARQCGRRRYVQPGACVHRQ
jgi:hypothetical protein